MLFNWIFVSDCRSTHVHVFFFTIKSVTRFKWLVNFRVMLLGSLLNIVAVYLAGVRLERTMLP